MNPPACLLGLKLGHQLGWAGAVLEDQAPQLLGGVVSADAFVVLGVGVAEHVLDLGQVASWVATGRA